VKKIVILTTRNGNSFADRILQSIHYAIGNHSNEGKQFTLKAKGYEIESFMRNHPELTPENCLFHARTAHPTAHWMNYMAEMEEQGFQFVNNIGCLKLTSDKWESYLKFKEIGKFPHTLLVKNINNFDLSILDNFTDKFIVKPRISQGNGSQVRLFDKTQDKITQSSFNDLSGEFLMQQYVDIAAIFRTFCFKDFAVPTVTMDNNPSWKKSVCLNKQQTAFFGSIDDILSYALNIQNSFGGDINFIDIFQLTNGQLILSEINTACNLIIHENKTKVSLSSYIAEYLIKKANE